MNTDHLINGWVAQLSLDARRTEAQRTMRTPEAAVAPVLATIATEPVQLAPARTRGHLLSARARRRDGASRRGTAQPCLTVA